VSALSWSLILQHCPSTCHSHTIQTFSGVAGGSFVAPDHEYPSWLELRLTATDTGGLTGTASVALYPQTSSLSLQTVPAGLQIVVGSYGSATTPFTRTVITGSNNSLSAPSPQTLGTQTYEFVSWSDKGEQTHNVIANGSLTYTATYEDVTPPTISNPRATGITTSTASIIWTTDEPASSRVEYGPTTAYGSFTTLDPTLITSHSQLVLGLESNATYHYRVISSDAAGNVSVSADRTFKTKKI
jgi:hypothetical protein